MIVRIPSNSYSREVEEGKVDMRAGRDKKVIEKKSYWMNVCEAFPLVCKSFKLKMIDHLLLGGEHARKISPGFSSPIKDEGEITPDEKKEIVKASPSFGMFSLFKYHVKHGYKNQELKENNKICGVIAVQNNKKVKIFAKSIILACGSFESNADMRAKYLGKEWKNIKLRGVPHNTGEGLEMAINHGAVPYDDWSTCHASPQDVNRPDFDLPGKNKSGDYWSRYAYPFSFMINQDGKRFVDEGETWRGLTYAKTGKAIIIKNQNFNPPMSVHKFFYHTFRTWTHHGKRRGTLFGGQCGCCTVFRRFR